MGQRGKDRMRGEMRRTVLFFVCCGLFYSSLVLVILVRYGEEREVGRKRKEKEGLVEMEGKREDRKVWKNGNQRKGGAKGMETAEKRMGDVNLSGVFCYLIRCSDVFCSLLPFPLSIPLFQNCRHILPLSIKFEKMDKLLL